MPISSVHFDLAVGLAALGTASSFAAGHLGAFTPYAFLANDLVAQAALYTHHQYIGGFFMCGAFAQVALDASSILPWLVLGRGDYWIDDLLLSGLVRRYGCTSG